MTYVVHVTINYPDCEMEYTHRHDNPEDVSLMIEGYLRETVPTSFIFVVSKEESRQ